MMELAHSVLLIADDDSFARKTLRRALGVGGFNNVLEAKDGVEACDLLNRGEVDLLITDVQMPGWNGIEMMRRIRSGQAGTRRDLRAIVHTSFAHRDVLGAAMALEVNGFLVKPVKAQMVRPKVVQALTESFSVRAPSVYASISSELQSVPQIEVQTDLVDAERALSEVPQELRHLAKWVDLRHLTAGARLVHDVVATDGTLLLRRGHLLTDVHINRLVDLGDVVASPRALILAPAEEAATAHPAEVR